MTDIVRVSADEQARGVRHAQEQLRQSIESGRARLNAGDARYQLARLSAAGATLELLARHVEAARVFFSWPEDLRRAACAMPLEELRLRLGVPDATMDRGRA